jgi:hypothetical protein
LEEAMKKFVFCLFVISLAVIGCKKEAAQPESDSAQAIKVMEEYFHRIGSGNFTDMEKIATKQAIEVVPFIYQALTDDQKSAFKNFKADVYDERIFGEALRFDITLLNKQIWVDLIKEGDTWKVNKYLLP